MNAHNEKEDMTDKVLEGLESTPVSSEDARQILADGGFDAERELANFKTRLTRRIRSHTWKTEADAKISAFGGKTPSRDWNTASEDEIDAAYTRLQETDYRMAARNLESVARDEKLAILEDVEFLNEEPEEGDI